MKSNMKADSIMWGLLFIGGGLVLLLAALGIGQEYELIRIIGSLLLLGLAITSFIKFRFFLSLIPLALIIYLWQKQLGLTQLNMTLLIIASIVLSIGLSIIFRKKHHIYAEKADSHQWSQTENVLSEDEFVSIDSSFGDQTKYIHASNLKRINIGSHFSSVKVYFDQCQLSPDGAQILVSANFSDVVLYVPRDWKIINHVTTFAASVKEKDERPVDVRTSVELSGSLNFAELKIMYL